MFRVDRRSALRGVAVAFIGSSAVALTSLIGAGGASAAPLVCDAVNGQQVNRVVGTGGCGARALTPSRAHAEDRSGVGTAVASAQRNGRANSYNTAPKSSALSGADSGGTSYSVTTGPGGLAVSQARLGGTSIAVAGIGGNAFSGAGGVRCSGGAAAAYDTTTGTYCFGTGRTYFTNVR
ncbi:DUF6764 family protein [Williamsia phyllosphaerae]|uniref:DUF6764 family protein n=1 Tax=Williamsia phyllosphaerae TaxID=885042 RepID=UPI00166551EC|nr:DUF6764 family protein [Williamsia phyllosphaerae]